MVRPGEHGGQSLACWRYAKMWWEHGRRLGYFLGDGRELYAVLSWVREGRAGRLTGAQVAFLVSEERAAAMRRGETVGDYRLRAVGARSPARTPADVYAGDAQGVAPQLGGAPEIDVAHARGPAMDHAMGEAVATGLRVESGRPIPASLAQPILATRSDVAFTHQGAPAISAPPLAARVQPVSPVIQPGHVLATATDGEPVRSPSTPTAVLPPPPSVAFSHPAARAVAPPPVGQPTLPTTSPLPARVATTTPPSASHRAATASVPVMGDAPVSPIEVTIPIPAPAQAIEPTIGAAPPPPRSQWARPEAPAVTAAQIPGETELPWTTTPPSPSVLAVDAVELWVPPAPATRAAVPAPVATKAPAAGAAAPAAVDTPLIAASRSARVAIATQGPVSRTRGEAGPVAAPPLAEAKHVAPSMAAGVEPEPAVGVVPDVTAVGVPDRVRLVAATIPAVTTLEEVAGAAQSPADVAMSAVALSAQPEPPAMEVVDLVSGVHAVGPVVATFTERPSRAPGNGWAPIQRRARRLVARWTVSHRDKRTGQLKWPRVTTEILSSLALVAAGFWGARTWNPAQAHPEVVVAEAPAPVPVQDAPSPMPDWADSIPNPDEVWGLQRSGRSYTPVGGGAPAPRSREPAWNTEGEVPRPIPPVLVRRVSGSSLMLYALTGDSLPLRGARWSLPGLCRQVLTVQGAADAWSATARDDGGQAGWLYGLAVPASQCTPASAQVIARVQPTTFEREALLRGLVSARGDLIGAELQDVAFGRIDGTRHAWGVFRIGGERITMVPAPPPHYVGFVATESSRKWTFQWLRSLEGERAQMALAGVFDTDNDGFPEAVFGQRDVGGLAEVAVVGQAKGTWSVRLTRALEASP